LVDVQIPLKILDPSIASRIDWKHGNLYVPSSRLFPTTSLNIQISLTTQLPFDDDEFDHVHVHAIARAVPENKVSFLEIFFEQS
jgi:hypothetical protein